MPTISDAVQSGVDAYGEAEAALKTAHDAILKLPAAYAAAFAANPPAPDGAKPFGYLESERRAAGARRLAGKVAELLSEVIYDHQDDTDRCKELGIDLPAPGGIHPDSGGGR